MSTTIAPGGSKAAVAAAQTAVATKKEFSPVEKYARYGLAGGSCATFAHTILVPMDVVKTRLQSNPGKYKGMWDGMVQISRAEGARALLLGLMPTFVGYSIQGAFKFGFFEFFKQLTADTINNPDITAKYKFPIYMVSSAAAETLATAALCPFEAIRIKMVTAPEYSSKGMVTGLAKILQTEGLYGWYKGLVPILMKQVPYTVMQLTTFQLSTDYMYNKILPSQFGWKMEDLSVAAKLSVTLSCGAFAGVVSAVVSHPADTVLTQLNMKEGNTIGSVVRQLGLRGIWYGVGARSFMVGLLSVVMFLINDSVKVACGLPISNSLDKKKESK